MSKSAEITVAYTRFKADKDIMDASSVGGASEGEKMGWGESKQRIASPGDVASGHALR